MTYDPKTRANAPLRLLTIKQVSELSGWSVSHIRRAIRTGKLAVVRLGRTIRVREADYSSFLASMKSARR